MFQTFCGVVLLQLRGGGYGVAGELHTHERAGLRDAAVLGQQHHRRAGPTLCLPYRGRRWVSKPALSPPCHSHLVHPSTPFLSVVFFIPYPSLLTFDAFLDPSLFIFFLCYYLYYVFDLFCI